MSPPDDRHRELLAKRRQLQARRERDACRATVAHELAVLDAAGTPYAMIWPEQLRENWLGRRFPWDIGRIRWAAVPGSERIPWQDPATCDAACLAAITELWPSPDEALMLVWGNALKPGLRLAPAMYAAIYANYWMPISTLGCRPRPGTGCWSAITRAKSLTGDCRAEPETNPVEKCKARLTRPL